ncbi:DUF3108 domain-containing protein [bacterium]|nr:DUF3108 domain-containing protein [bacterium]
MLVLVFLYVVQAQDSLPGMPVPGAVADTVYLASPDSMPVTTEPGFGSEADSLVSGPGELPDPAGPVHTDSMIVVTQAPVDSLPTDTTAAVKQGFRRLENQAFQTGEFLEFEIAWKFLKAGTATMSVGDTLWNGIRPCYHIKTTANSSSVIDVFFKVRDRVESIIDREGLFPWKFEKHLREGNFRRNRYTVFDPVNQRAFVRKDTVHIPLYVQDILSSFYYVRSLPLEVGKHYDIDNLSDKKVYPLRILVHKKETAKVPAGRFKCIVVEPVLRGEGLFNQKGRLTIWLTDDRRRMPVLMKSEVFIGSVDAKLTSHKNTVKP